MKPNILFICTDQQRGDALGVENHPVLLTPNMDDIARNGVMFNHFYSDCPSCIAARRSILSGQHPVNHGMRGYHDGIEWFPEHTLPGVLQANGYQTYHVGRDIHQHPRRKRYGFDGMETIEDYKDWLAEYGPKGNQGWMGGGIAHNDYPGRPWYLDEHYHFTNWTADRAIKFLGKRDPSSPYFLHVSFIAPHPPLQPPQFYFDRYIRTGVPDPIIGDWETPPDPGQLGDNVAPSTISLSGEELLTTRAAYYGLINHIDDQMRQLLNPIGGEHNPRCGVNLRDTIVIFTSDHGEMLGDHYMFRKSRAFEPSARVPFLIRAPEEIGLKTGLKIDSACTLADIMPTVLDMVDIDIPDSVDGESLLPAMRGGKVPDREYIHIEHAPTVQAVTDGVHKFIWDSYTGLELFFNLDDDPDETRNLLDVDTENAAHWRDILARHLKDRPEGFSDGTSLIPGNTSVAATQ